MECQARESAVGARLVVFNLCSLEHPGLPAEVPQRPAGQVGLGPTALFAWDRRGFHFFKKGLMFGCAGSSLF